MLTIQKLIVLLEPGHSEAFKKHLSETGSALPLKLFQVVENYGMEQPESELLCAEVYGDSDEKSKRKFFQLAHYTFRLTSFLSKRYPFYLSHNISRIELLLNAGKKEEALLTADHLLDISLKTEDYSSQLWVLKFLINYSLIREKRKEAIRLQIDLNKALANEVTINDITLYIRENLNFKDKNNITEPDIEKHISYFSSFTEHESFVVKILSRYGKCYTLSFLDDKQFYTPEVKTELEFITDELDKHAYVLFPFADDVLLNIDYLLLKHRLKELNEEEIVKEATRLTKKWNSLSFWQNHINTAEIVSLSLQASYYITHYCICYKENFEEEIPQHMRDNIRETLGICEKMIEQLRQEKEAHVRFINLNNIYCTLLMLSGRENIKKAIQTIEGLLINYQQIPFQKLYDALFANLIIGYFSIQNYNAANECYRRYEKLTAKKVKIEENDLTIKAFYYMSQWLLSNREQYVEKIEGLMSDIKDKPALNTTLTLIQQLAGYYKLPLKTR